MSVVYAGWTNGWYVVARRPCFGNGDEVATRVERGSTCARKNRSVKNCQRMEDMRNGGTTVTELLPCMRPRPV